GVKHGHWNSDRINRWGFGVTEPLRGTTVARLLRFDRRFGSASLGTRRIVLRWTTGGSSAAWTGCWCFGHAVCLAPRSHRHRCLGADDGPRLGTVVGFWL